MVRVARRRGDRRLMMRGMMTGAAIGIVGLAGLLATTADLGADDARSGAVRTAAACTATDGDTIRCGDERIRLNGIDAPELAGHCRQGRNCAPGDPAASKAHLAALLTGPATIQPLKLDRYGRTVAMVRVGPIDLSCAQLKAAQAVYRPEWDEGRRLARTCGV